MLSSTIEGPQGQFTISFYINVNCSSSFKYVKPSSSKIDMVSSSFAKAFTASELE